MRNPLHGLLFLFVLATAPALAAPNTWSLTGDMSTQRNGLTSTLLPSGKVLVTGGGTTPSFSGSGTATAELFDPATGLWTATASMSVVRQFHSAILLRSGLVLVTGGGSSETGPVIISELYDPATGQWTLTGAPEKFRALATATLLPSGKVLVTGGLSFDPVNQSAITEATAELYDPSTGEWTATATMSVARVQHAATLLPSGYVLVSGGAPTFGGTAMASAELYDPNSGIWITTGAMNVARAFHVATLMPTGKVLAMGSFSDSSASTSSAELYDPSTGVWTSTSSTNTQHAGGATALLPSGNLLVAGGFTSSASEIFDSSTGQWSPAAPMSSARGFAGLTILATGKVLVVGGSSITGGTVFKSAELFDPASGHFGPVLGTMANARQSHTATSLGSGKVLFAGGFNSARSSSAEVFNVSTQQWTASVSMLAARARHTATRLATGKVLVAGGNSGGPDAELYDPAAGAWAATPSMAFAREGHSATLLPSGKVLISGGMTSVPANAASAEIYDPASGQWSAAGSMQMARAYHTATLLSSGKVLVAGGVNPLIVGAGLASAELYDPATNQWTSTGPLSAQRDYHSATLLPSGKVMVVGGFAPQSGTYSPACELYDPASGLWAPTGLLDDARASHTATLLPSGSVLVAGGTNGTAALSSAEIYDPATAQWTTIDPLDARSNHSATLLPSGVVLIGGGSGDTGTVSLATGVLFDPGLVPTVGVSTQSVRQPTLSSVPAMITQGGPFTATSSGSSTSVSGTVTATGFMPRLEASFGQSANSASNSPVVQVQRLDNEQVRFLRNHESVDMIDTNWVSAADTLLGFPPGPVVVRVWVNGVPSTSVEATLRSDRIFANGFEGP